MASESDNILSPLDGRYSKFTKELKECMSDYAYYINRIIVENTYLVTILEKLNIPFDENKMANVLRELEENPVTITNIKELEKTTNHDVKAITDYITLVLKKNDFPPEVYNKVHYCLTSQDVNSIGQMIGFRKGVHIITNKVYNLLDTLKRLAKNCDMPIISKTHGQPAVPTNLMKEIYIYIHRLQRIITDLCLKTIPHLTVKFGGAVGNFNAHYFTHPEIDWIAFGNEFAETFGFLRSEFTTQVDDYDSLSTCMSLIKKIATIALSLEQNLWLYISDGYFKQTVIKNEVGSSTMPHKVNPIQFENAEGNLLLGMQMADVIIVDLPMSRYQRILRDSTLLRSVGNIFGYICVGLDQICEGVSRLSPNNEIIQKDLDENCIVILEGIQCYLKMLGFDDPYTITKELSRGKQLSKDDIDKFIDSLDINQEHKTKLKGLTVRNYVGQFPHLTLLDI